MTVTLPEPAAEALTAVCRMRLQRPGQVVADLLYRYLPDFASELVEADLRPPIDVESRTGSVRAEAARLGVSEYQVRRALEPTT